MQLAVHAENVSCGYACKLGAARQRPVAECDQVPRVPNHLFSAVAQPFRGAPSIMRTLMHKVIPPPRADGYTSSTLVPLYWAAYGPEGKSPLLVLHGGPGASHDYLLPQMLELARDRELIFYDQRGGGRSRQEADVPITWRTQVEDLGAVAREFSLEPLSIVGYSWGGLLAMLYAIEAAAGRAPISPARMVLIDPAPADRGHRQEFEAEFNRRQQSETIRRMREELAASGLQQMDRDAYRQRAFELSVAGYFADPARAADLTPFRVIGKVQKSIWDSLGDYDLSAGLATVSCPALVVHGSEDPIPVAASRKTAEALSARFVLLEGSGHVPYVEQPDQLFPAVAAFLDETDA